jgi:tripartite-type tricarboxylate transporter receptor subunit TctC
MQRRNFSLGMAGAAVALQAFPVVAQSERVLKLVVPFPPGGAADLIGRTLAQKLTGPLGQAVVVENRAGAAGSIGSDYVAKAAPDGQTLLLGTISTHGTSPVMSAKSPYDPVKDFTHISLLALNPLVLIAHPSVPAASLREFVRYAKANPGLSFGSNGHGSYNHLAMELFKEMTGIGMLHVPYKGAAPLMNDLVAGQIQFAAADLAGATPYIRTGKVKAYAIASRQRVAGIDVPTVVEAGYPAFEVSAWYALFGPANLPQPQVARLHVAVHEALTAPDFQERLRSLGAMVVEESPAQLRERVTQENHRWAAVVRTARISPE